MAVLCGDTLWLYYVDEKLVIMKCFLYVNGLGISSNHCSMEQKQIDENWDRKKEVAM